MRVFRDSTGKEWEVAVGRESWGTVVAIFFLRKEGDPPRQTLLKVSSADEGNRLVLGMTRSELQSLLDESVLKPTE